MTDELTQKVVKILAAVKRIPVESIRPEATLEELGIDSLDKVNILFELEGEFNIDFEHTQSRDAVSRWATQLPDFVDSFAAACGTDRIGYFTEGPGLSAFARSGEDVYLAYATGARGLEPVMGYYGILDRVPRQRDEAAPLYNTWVRRHDEYDAR